MENGLTQQQIENRHEFIVLLRTNPYNLVQTANCLILDGEGGACALGVWAYHKGYRAIPGKLNHEAAYNLVEKDLGIFSNYSGGSDMRFIWNLNDVKLFSFAAIADELEKRWFGSVTISAEQITENKS